MVYFDQYNNSLSSNFDGRDIVVCGIYKDNKRNNYNGFYYDDLVGHNSDEGIRIKVGDILKASLVSGQYYELSGFVERGNVKDSNVPLIFNVAEIVGHDKHISKISESDFDLIKSQFDTGLADIRASIRTQLREKKDPRSIIITGNDSIVDKDFFRALGSESKDRYKIIFQRTNISSRTEIIYLFNQLEIEADSYLVFMRGGGSGMDVFEHKELCKKVLELNIPFITAIGHDVNQPYLQKLSDLSFSTPSAFGTFLKELVEQDFMERNNLIRKEQVIKSREDTISLLRVKMKKHYVIIGILIIAILLLLYFR